MLIISLILFQVFIFVGLALMLRRIMTKNVTDATRHLEELNQDYAKKEEELNRQLQEAQQKSQNILKEAQGEAEKLKTQTIKEAEGERDKILEQARTQSDTVIQQAEKSRQVLIAELEERIKTEAVNKACELMQVTLPEQFKQDVHLHWVEELLENGFSQLEHLRLPQGIREIKITSAFPLTEGQRKNLSKKLKNVLGDEMVLKEEVEPKVVAGLIITIGSLVLDGSLKNKIKEHAKSA